MNKQNPLMEFRTFLAINAVIAVPTGVACVLVPARLLATCGVTLTPMGSVVYQFWGAALIGLGLLAWCARGVEEAGLQKAIALSLFITYAISCVIAVRGQFAGANNLGWSAVALFLVLSLGYGWLAAARSRTLERYSERKEQP
jgi:hypothetical protein